MPNQRVLFRPVAVRSIAVTPVYQTRHRLLRERVEGVLRRGEAGGHPQDEDTLRLAAAALVLLERHPVDGKGRCRVCRSGGRWWAGRKRSCSVFAVLDFYLDEPIETVWRQVGTIR